MKKMLFLLFALVSLGLFLVAFKKPAMESGVDRSLPPLRKNLFNDMPVDIG
jgi:hypothetical protein